VHFIITIDLTILTIIYCKQTTLNNVEKFYYIFKQRDRTRKNPNSIARILLKILLFFVLISTNKLNAINLLKRFILKESRIFFSLLSACNLRL